MLCVMEQEGNELWLHLYRNLITKENIGKVCLITELRPRQRQTLSVLMLKAPRRQIFLEEKEKQIYRPVCFVFERARASSRNFLHGKGHPTRNCKFLL